jgi:dethiobiotin synthetase
VISTAYYISGTDTGIGKTHCSVALLHALRRHGLRSLGMKPLASGCEDFGDGLRNEDALALLAAGHRTLPYELINPYALREPTAPEIAAARDRVTIELEPIARAFAELQAAADVVLVEGVGGWLAPLSDTLMQSDLARRLQLPVILVVGLRLGCINHALLSARAIAADGLTLAGWIGNAIDPELSFAVETVAILRARLPVPCLGLLPYGMESAQAAEELQLGALLDR